MTTSRQQLDQRIYVAGSTARPIERTPEGNLHWRDYAACARSCDPEAWWPESHAWRAPTEARRVCVGCPVRWQCLQHALDNDEPGVWGGLTETERKHMNHEARTLVGKLARQPINLAAAAL